MRPSLPVRSPPQAVDAQRRGRPTARTQPAHPCHPRRAAGKRGGAADVDVIQLPFDPNVHLGPITLAWHGIFTAVGIFFGVALPIRLLRGRVREDDAYAVAWWGVIGGIVGARVVHVIDQFSYYAAHPE
ncbi:MAG: prolipoprotein diacylglyceryl transferase, partial [Chloroflexi bacterium]